MADQKVVLIVQHGEKEPFPGDPGLTAKGRRQATAAGKWIQNSFPSMSSGAARSGVPSRPPQSSPIGPGTLSAPTGAFESE